MSDQELSGSADNQHSENEGSQQSNQRPKGPSKIPGTAVFRAPYPQGKAAAPYYIISNTPNNVGALQQMNASDEDKRRIMHNEVERRRKEKINKWIVRLCAIVPNCNSGKLSKNCVLEKTVHFLNQLMKERDLPENVQTLRAEVMSLTEKVESLSAENAMYLNLLKEAQSLSGGAWSLNMSIQSNKPEIVSSSDDSSSTTMTPTLDRIEIPATNVRIAPNLPTAATSSSSHPIFATIPILQTAGGQSTILTSGSGQPILGHTVQPIITQMQSIPTVQAGPMRNSMPNIPVMQSGTMGSMVTAIPANQIFQQRPMSNGSNGIMSNTAVHMASGQTVMANGQAFLAQNGAPVLANGAPVQVAPVVQLGSQQPAQTSAASRAKSSHSIQALLSTATTGGLTGATGNKTVYTIPAYNYGLQTVNNNQHGNIYIPTAGAQTPVLVQGEQGHVVMVMTPGTNPYFAIPLNTMSSSHVMCEPTASFKSPIVWNQLPPTNQQYQQEPVKSMANIMNIIPQSINGQQPVIQQPVIQLPVVQNGQPVAQVLSNQHRQQAGLGVQQIQQMNQQPMVGVQQQPMNMLGVQQQPMNMVGVQQQPMNMVSVQQQPMVGVQQQPMVGVQQQPMVGVQLMNQGMNIQGSQILNQGGQVVQQEHTIIQVPNNEVLIPHSQTQCFIPVVQNQVGQVRQNSIIATVAPVTSTTNKVTDFSINNFIGGEAATEVEEEEEYREYLRTSDTR